MKEFDEDFEEMVPEFDDSGPFSVEAVDPLVYTMDETSPELRAAASYIPVAPKLTIRDAAPVPPRARKHDAWTPGGEATEPVEITPSSSPALRIFKRAFSLLLVIIPLAAVAGIVWLGYSLYTK